MITTFRHKGLAELFERGATRRIDQKQIRRCEEILAALDAARIVQDMNAPTYRLHNLAPSRPNTWTVRVNGAWRITFGFKEGNAYDVDLEQYH